MEKRVIGVFQTEALAISAINRLKTDGYADEEISIIVKQKEKLERIEEKTHVQAKQEHNSSVVTGAVTGGVIGGIGALLLELGVFAIPGVGPLLAAGPIALTLAGIAAGGTIGGVSGALIHFGFSETEANEYAKFLNEGNILILVDERYNVERVYHNFYENESLVRDMYFGEQINQR